MIYFDNAATTCPKPVEVAEALTRAVMEFGGAGRGVHPAAVAASMAVFEAREAVAQLLGASSSAQVAFMSNATEALNTAIAGLLRPGDYAVTTAASHNSVLRPLYKARDAGCTLGVANIFPDGSLDYDDLARLVRPGTRLVVVTHASNLTGDVYDIARIAQMAHERGALIVVDAAQTVGAFPLDVTQMELDALAFTGHKSMFGPQGTGGLVVAKGLDIAPLKVGGSGILSFDEEHPAFMPEHLEAGTLNAHGLAALAEGVAFIKRTGLETIQAHDEALRSRFVAGVRTISGVNILGGNSPAGQVGICAVCVEGVDAGTVADCLARDFGIATRAGAHCAPLMHKAMGTEAEGAVRFSFSWFNTEEEVDSALEALSEIVQNVKKSAVAN